MDFAKMTTDDLLAALPPGEENSRWEMKSAEYLDTQKRSDFKAELSKQVSAFANSGGGTLILGISKTGQIEPCPDTVGRQSMKDWLAVMVDQSVEFSISTFQIHRIPLTSDQSKAVYAIAIEDSPVAPH